MSQAARSTTRVHTRATRLALRAYREAHPELYQEVWDLLREATRIMRPDLGARAQWDATKTAVVGLIAEERPEEWAALRAVALEQAKAEHGWVDGRAAGNADKGRDQPRVGGRFAATS